MHVCIELLCSTCKQLPANVPSDIFYLPRYVPMIQAEEQLAAAADLSFPKHTVWTTAGTCGTV